MKYIKNRISYQNGLILKALVLLCIFILLLPREGKTSIVLKGGVQPAGEVWLTGIEIDGNDSDLRKYPLSGKWRWISNSIVYVPDETAKGDSLELLFSNAQSIKLIFNMHNWSGGVGIQDGSSYVEYNLHEEAGQKEYVVKKIPIESPNVLFTLLSIVVFGMIVLELSKLEKTLFANPDSITFAKKWGVLALNGLTIAIAMGAIGEALYIELWLLMMYVLFCVNRKKAVLDYFWISTLVSYVYRIYYLLHPYILSPLMIFSYLLLLNTFYSFQIGKGQTWSKWVTIILMPVLGLGIVEITGNSDIGNLIPSMLMLNLVLLSLYFAVFSNLIRYKNLGWYIANFACELH